MSGADGTWWDEVEMADQKLVLRVRPAAEGVHVVVDAADGGVDVVLPRDAAAALGAALSVAAGSMDEPAGARAPAMDRPASEVGFDRAPAAEHQGAGTVDPTRPWHGPRPGLPESLALRRQALEAIRAIVAGLPETAEIEALGAPTFRVAARTFGVVETDDGLPVLRVKLPVDDQATLLADDRYRADTETGVHGWTSVRLDLAGEADLRRLLVAGYRHVAPAHLAASVPTATPGLFDRD